MFDARRAAAACGLAVEWTDLGEWPGTELVAEYDGFARTIRVNSRALEAYRNAYVDVTLGEVAAYADLAIAHELYHHREATGEVARLATRSEREAAADAFARANVPVDPRLAAFMLARIRQ